MSRLSAVGFPDERDAIAEPNVLGEVIMGDQSRDGSWSSVAGGPVVVCPVGTARLESLNSSPI